jgi:hypothetical protein
MNHLLVSSDLPEETRRYLQIAWKINATFTISEDGRESSFDFSKRRKSMTGELLKAVTWPEPPLGTERDPFTKHYLYVYVEKMPPEIASYLASIIGGLAKSLEEKDGLAIRGGFYTASHRTWRYGFYFDSPEKPDYAYAEGR